MSEFCAGRRTVTLNIYLAKQGCHSAPATQRRYSLADTHPDCEYNHYTLAYAHRILTSTYQTRRKFDLRTSPTSLHSARKLNVALANLM